jgi:nucleoside-diphosphate-sugar epimerase
LLVTQKAIVVTGAAGFLGSAITVDLSRDHHVVAIDRRTPTDALLAAAEDTSWHQVDIADGGAVALAFQRARRLFGRLDYVVHFAAFYHFGTDWHREYESTNVQGTSHVLQAAARHGVQRVVFASSVAAMSPPPPGKLLTERTPTADYIPYAKSKSIGERMIREASDRLPSVVLRIGGAFSDWCELPPLGSLIELWGGRTPLSRLVVGQGRTGMPYIHRDDVVRIVRACIDRHEVLDRYEVFLASQHGAVLHKELFPAVHQAGGKAAAVQPIFLAPRMARIGLHIRRAIGYLTRNVPYERPWMLKYVDRPWVADTTYTRSKLGWTCTEGMGILDRIAAILEHFRRDRHLWRHRNRIRYHGGRGR